jgi:hypothetical protein
MSLEITDIFHAACTIDPEKTSFFQINRGFRAKIDHQISGVWNLELHDPIGPDIAVLVPSVITSAVVDEGEVNLIRAKLIDATHIEVRTATAVNLPPPASPATSSTTTPAVLATSSTGFTDDGTRAVIRQADVGFSLVVLAVR